MDHRRLLLLLIFSFSTVMLWDAWQKYNLPKAPPVVAAGTAEAPAPKPSSSLHTPLPEAPASVAAAAPEKTETVTIRTDLFTAEVSLQGGDIVRLDLKNYRDSVRKDKDFALFEPKHQYYAQSGLIGDGLPNHRTRFSVAPGKRELGDDAQELVLRLEAEASDGVRVAKIYTFKRGSYLIGLKHEIENAGKKELVAHAYYQLQRDVKAPDGESSMVSTFTGPAVFTDQEKFQKVSFSDIEAGKPKFATKADNGWIAMIQHYFASAWIPEPGLPREFYMRKLENTQTPAVAAGVIVPVPV
ncbi:MAG TPA: membrane protein insertase YidC, partial [Candidatus Accumulibacter sp.]|nr:membrane protein insertase YidC [Accumulibacter sp.]